MAKVLVVDDVHDNVKLLAYDLTDVGYEVATAYNGQQALDMAAKERPDVILLDIMMPEMDGIEVCRRLKADLELRHIPIIMVSALGKEEDVIRGLDAGAMDYVTKPFSFPVVLARVRSAIRIITDHYTIERMNLQLDAARQQAEVASQSKSAFLANMSHEIRTPMTAILGFAENMLEADQPESQRLNCAHTIRRNGEYLLELINDILDLSKIEAGRLVVEQVACKPCELIAEVASLMRVRADAKGLPFKTEYIGAIPETIVSDPTRVRQILINLIGNAIKFTEAGVVRLVTSFVDNGDKPYLQFDVIDTGRGITQEQLPRLFLPFLQADTSTTREFGGTGLGLTISKRFAQLLRGDVTVFVTQAGVGSTFRAVVPTGPLDGVKMLEDPASATIVTGTDNAVARITESDLHGCRILLVEDSLDNQRLISFILKKAGADVTPAENGKLALGAALAARGDDKPFDIILMDMQMPVMDGYEAASQLRRKGYTTPIIALTAHAMEGDHEKCIKAGCDDYTTKPIDWRKLIALIQKWRQERPISDKKDISRTATLEPADALLP